MPLPRNDVGAADPGTVPGRIRTPRTAIERAIIQIDIQSVAGAAFFPNNLSAAVEVYIIHPEPDHHRALAEGAQIDIVTVGYSDPIVAAIKRKGIAVAEGGNGWQDGGEAGVACQ